MQRGTKVGQAYVALAVDGDHVNKDIVDAFDDVDYKELGDRFGEQYAERVRGHLKGVNKDFDQSIKRMGRSIESDNAISQGIRHQLAKAFDNGDLDRISEEVGRRAGVQMGSGLDDSLKREVNRAVIDSLERSMQRAGRTSGKGFISEFVRSVNSGSGQIDLPGGFLDEAVEDVKRVVREQEKTERAYTRFLGSERRKRERLMAQAASAQERRDAKIALDAERYAKEYTKFWETALKKREDAEIRMGRMHAAALRLNEKHNQGLLNGRGYTMPGNGRDDRGISDAIGRMFGRGSRNNALNLLGSVMGSVARLTEKSAQFATGFAKGIGDAADGASLIQKAMSGFSGGGAASGLSGAFSGIAKSGPAAAIAIVGVTAAMVAMVSVAGALLGILTAITSTILSGLVGAVAVLSGGLVALAAAGGLLTVAFLSMTQAQKTMLTDAFSPLKQQFTDLGQIMIRDMVPAFSTWSTNLQRAVALAEPIARRMGTAFAEAGNKMTAAFSGPGFQKLATALAVYLPSIVTRLSSAFSGFLNGLAAMFAAILPSVNRFAGYLADVAEEFSEWANSARGQNSIKDFVDRATDSFKSAWRFLKQLGGLLSDVLFSPSAQKSGNGIFDGLADALQRARKAISRADLEKWFKDAKKFAEALGKAIGTVTRIFQKLYDSGTIDAIADGLSALSDIVSDSLPVIDKLIEYGSTLPGIFSAMTSPIETIISLFNAAKDAVKGLGDALGNLPNLGGIFGKLGSLVSSANNASNAIRNVNNAVNNAPRAPSGGGGGRNNIPKGARAAGLPDDLLTTASARKGKTGKGKGNGKDDEWKNPWRKWAQSLIDDGPSMRTLVNQAARTATREFQAAMREATATMNTGFREANRAAYDSISSSVKAGSGAEVQDLLKNAVTGISDSMRAQVTDIRQTARANASSLREEARNIVSDAQQNLNDAARDLANATTPKEAQRAKKRVNQAQKDLKAAENAARRMNKQADDLVKKADSKAKNLQNRINLADEILNSQRRISTANVNKLVAGQKAVNVTLAEYAEARAQVAEKLAAANDALVEAIQLRDSYRDQIADSIKSFGALTTAQAQVIDGVEQALTANDIVGNLQDRLNQIKTFRANLQKLLSLGLSNDAYKQIVDMGVEGGSAFAEALAKGGSGAVGQTNNLVNQIDKIADQMGIESSNRLYQAGVDAAKGLVDGLTSLSAQLDSAALKLGLSIANQIKKALGIKSPSRVMIAAMDDVGDGVVVGLGNQGPKVGVASDTFARRIAVSPEVATYASRTGMDPYSGESVSGNSGNPLFRDFIVQTPTKDPKAVATEALNELTGRL